MGFFDRFKKSAPPPPPPPPPKKSPLEEQLSPLYPPLARQIAAMTPADWEILWFLGEVEPGKASYSNVFYIREAGSGRIVRSNDFSKVYGVPNAAYIDQWSKLNDRMLAIWQCFLDNGHKPWEQMTMTLERSGKFNIHFNYDNVHAASGGQPDREVLWAYRTFGYRPEEGSWMRKLLDEQLQGDQAD